MIYSESCIHRIKEERNWAYIFDDEGSFRQPGYNPLRLKGQNSLPQCSRARFKGKREPVYFTDFKSLSYILASLQADVQISPECIYFDPAIFEPYLVYIPWLRTKVMKPFRDLSMN